MTDRNSPWRPVDLLFPAVAYLRTKDKLARMEERTVGEWRSTIKVEAVGEWAKSIYLTELERAKRLEDKLQFQLTTAAIWTPFVTGGLALALHNRKWLALFTAILAAAELIAAYFLGSLGSEPREIHVLFPRSLYDPLLGNSPLPTSLAVEAMVDCEANAEIALRLQNAAWSAAASLRRVAFLMALTGVLLVVPNYGNASQHPVPGPTSPTPTSAQTSGTHPSP